MSNLDLLRGELERRGLDGFVVPLTDEHMSEYVGDYAQRLQWLTGFKGSAGTAAVLRDRAAIFVDGRYTLQVRAEVDGAQFEYRSVPAESVAGWLRDHAPDGAKIGHDPWLGTRGFVTAVNGVLAAKGGELVAVGDNPVDAVWADRPAPPTFPIEVHPEEFAGESSASKRERLGKAVKEAGADAAVIAALDSVAWLFNIRGRDVARTPVARAFALLCANGTAMLFTDPAKLTPEVIAHLGADVTCLPYDSFADTLRGMAGKAVLADPATCVAAIFGALAAGTVRIVEGRDPCALPKATKNAAEVAGTRAAHRRDGVAVTKFLHWFDNAAARGGLDELTAQAQLEAFRRESNLLKDLSFDSISGWAGNGAIVHYRASEQTNKRIEGDGLYLIDSGGQYPDGTTDITRTVAVGTPTPEQRDAFTRVLKGHIALATARFPVGTRGLQLDSLARQHLWAAEMDYAHGTGHGVGSYLAVHEGPARIASAPGANGVDEPLRPGMILSNEPGFYKTDGYGIRVENLVLVVEGGPGWLAFETLTLAPIDTRLIECKLMTDAELDWLNAYHARVREALGEQLEGEARAWLERATAPLARPLARAA